MRRPFMPALLALALVLAGCGLGRSEYADDPDYKAGHSDGCWTATSQVPGDPESITRNEEAWKSSEAYRAGWKAGYNACVIRDRSGSMGMPDMPERGTGVR
ncbi:hypothetical protein [Parvibaculum sp.]|jgi:hypothetical protein|uniref:hypothetical protein n=1 Tax=Parvibaculum sp. TaxID=2024848 RepID=UPI000C373605|nr:hypothetical protein [Parvibaculum sp.]MAU62230.1 hypothetical protein [Parvibaculum sp.]MBO6667122.1 hypothetical protein [Parvibaculum sp.]MBO6692270.1 hypothetical protein [Parvibaculum sp.]MBO6713675.1 hypothetical protein [Parvibaculum sp.]|tara:strand:- start:6732 stop:7034 length:303 start_codon:yes stop_codon:yes gene_type:complete